MPDIERMKANPSAVTNRLEAFVPNFSPDTLNKIAGQFEWVGYYPIGHEVIRQGELGDAMYIIDRGLARVTRNFLNLNLDVPAREIAELKAGDVFGEMALVNGQPRNANVIAKSELAVFRLAKDDWRRLCAVVPMLEDVFARIATSRLPVFSR